MCELQPSPSDRVRASARFIASLPNSSVAVHEDRCQDAAAFLTNHLSAAPRTLKTISDIWRGANGLHPTKASRSALEWIFLVDTLNFCFWAPPDIPRWRVSYRGSEYQGYWALCAAVNRALDERIPLTDPAFYATVDKDRLAHIFRSANDTPIPLLDERVDVLNEAGKVLTDKFEGFVKNMVDAAHGSAQALVQMLVDNFSSYNDAVSTSGVFTTGNNAEGAAQQEAVETEGAMNELCFFKRAQIFVADVWACFATTNQYSFPDISSLTMFADYRVPQVLTWLHTIEYSDELQAMLHRGEELPPGDRREIEIRGCAIHAVELIRKEMERLAAEEAAKAKSSHFPRACDRVVINAIVIDYALWDYGTKWQKELSATPFHRTKSVFY